MINQENEFDIPSSLSLFLGIFQDPKRAQVFTFASEKVQIGVDLRSHNRQYKEKGKKMKKKRSQGEGKQISNTIIF